MAHRPRSGNPVNLRDLGCGQADIEHLLDGAGSLTASGEPPVRRLGGRVYVVTAGLRELVA
jgi:hypothetical protein